MHQLSPLIFDLAIMLGLASMVVLLFQRIHQPVVLGYLVAGMIIGPYTPPHAFVSDVENIQVLSELGVIFLMFSLGLEFSFQKLARVGFSASITGIIEVILMIAIGYGVGRLAGFPTDDALFLGAALSISSTTIIIKAIDDLKLKTKRFAEIIFGVLIVEDLLAILLLVALGTLVLTKNILSIEMFVAIIKLILVVGGWFIVGYFLVPPLFEKIAKYINSETLIITSVALCLFLVCVASSFHYSTALGAFIMGSILAETVFVHRIEELIRPVRNIFAAVFFISIGMLIDPIIIINNWQMVLLISLITILGKLITTSIAAFLTGQSVTTSIRVGFSMAQVGEFSFIIVALGSTLGVISNTLYPLIVAVSGITTFTTPYLIKLSGKIATILEESLPPRTKFFLESYSSWVYRTQTTTKGSSFLSTMSMRTFINGILIAIIFTLVHFFFLKKGAPFSEKNWINNILFLVIALLFSSPFIWGMLFSYKKVKFPAYAHSTFTPAAFIIWLIAFSEISILSILYFQSWVTISIIFAIAAFFFIISYRYLERSYHWFEAQFVNNLKNKEIEQKKRYEELAPWDTHLVEMTVNDHSILIGKSLAELQIRQEYGINIVAISHGARVIAAPRGNEKIFAQDKLILLGNDTQIDAFMKLVEIENGERPQNFLNDFVLISILLKASHPFVGQSIRHSKIREKVNGLIVGLERDNMRVLNPDPDIILKENDLVLIVGEVDKMKEIS